ncbi:hypothetical protein HanRHA438_Chr12g0551971 [Helianthus annuus]|uniref:Uncharacterized protein n=1 Tax=Helianthus annuus TaxID=4232 RepID=A0A9K3HGH8_HELAN|nr:hypothetical protein HanXRQr2_Chr12g0541081 [Helianthus annuus]KAJ0505247.1 hypothetical protein HanHA89_Chr12g0468361 [Helianthus annuus]KAJ0674929.1 hypothetical protein HanLR1_Chr12g0445461 [Helianthus annuus]KAJ0866455.1 hypothetical protein HanRHA438_Chr12g0551971 [Helianthus annuus]
MYLQGRGKDSDKGHNVSYAIDADTTTGTVVEKMAEFLRESRVAKAISNRTVVYESLVRAFWDTARFDESDSMIHVVLKKKDKNGKDEDVEIKFGVADVRRVLDLQDSDDDPTIMSERLVKGLWCRMGFTGYINGKMYKRNFSKAYRYMMHCMVHSRAHRKGAYDEVVDYIINFIASLVLNRRYNMSQVIFEYMKENDKNEVDRYIMYPRFIMMIINDQIKDLPKDSNDVMELSNVNLVTIGRITKDKYVKTKQLICRIKNKEYVAPEDDKWRHDNSDSHNENEKMKDMVEKKTRWWCVRDGKRKRTPKSSPAVVIPKEGEKGSSGEPQQRLVDETVLEPSVVIKQGAELLKHYLESYLKKKEDVAAQQAQGSSANVEKVTRVEPETEARNSASDEDSEATQSQSKLIPETLGRGRAQLKKKPSKKQKGSDEEGSPYDPEKSKKQRKKRKAPPAGIIPRNVRAKKSEAESQKDKDGKKDQHEKTPSVEIPKEPEVQTKVDPIVEAEKKADEDDYVEIKGLKAASPLHIPQDIPESSNQKDTSFCCDFDDLGTATGIFTEDLPEGESDMFNDKAVKELVQKVNNLEKEKAKTELERDILKKQVDLLMKGHDQLREELMQQNEEVNKARNEAEDNSKLFDLLAAEITDLCLKIKQLEEVNQTLNQLLSEMSEPTSNEMKAMKLEMEAMKADKVMKDQQLQMLTAVVESHLKMNIHAAFEEIDVIQTNERRMERERRLAEEATQKNKGVAEEVEVVDGSSS